MMKCMHVVSYKAIRVFCERQQEAKAPLDRWYQIARRATRANFAEVRASFSGADVVAPHIVLDIGGNKFRLIAEINFRSKILFIRHLLTHKEYEKGVWNR